MKQANAFPHRPVSPTARPARRPVLRLLSAAAVIGMTGAVSTIVMPHARAAEARRIAVEIKERHVVGAGNVIRVGEGDMVELVWSTDERVELHLHGYDIELTVTPGNPAVMRFEAYASGRFPVTSHGFGDGGDHGGHDTALIYFEVHPH